MLDLRSAKVLVLAALATVLVLSTNFSTAVFTDSSASTARVTAAADWTPPEVELPSTASYLRGTVPLTPSASDGESELTGVTVEHSPAGAGSWTTFCSDSRSSYTCGWDTTRLADGRYDVRASATDAAGYTGYTAPAAVTVDNTAPTVTLTDPGSPLTETMVFATTGVSDATSGVARVEVQHLLAGASTWRTLCVATATPWSCSADTTTLADASYGFRAVATDRAGNVATTPAVHQRLVDNAGPSVTLEDPGTVLTGSVTLRATATSVAGVTSVQFQYAPSGTSAWVNVGTPDTSAPYSQPWSTTTLTEGRYDLRAVVVDAAGRTATSAVLSRSTPDSSPPLAGLDVQSANGGSPTVIDEGDTITFTYTRKISASSVLAGWSGSATPVSVQVRDGRLLGLGNKQARLEVLAANGRPVNLGSVDLGEGYLKNGGTAVLSATMVASTATVDGRERTDVTVTLGTPVSGADQLQTVPQPATMDWTPSAAVTDLANRSAATTRVVELGALDVDF